MQIDTKMTMFIPKGYFAIKTIIADLKTFSGMNYKGIPANRKKFAEFISDKIEIIADRSVGYMKSLVRTYMPYGEGNILDACTVLKPKRVYGGDGFGINVGIFDLRKARKANNGKYIFELHEEGTKPYIMTRNQWLYLKLSGKLDNPLVTPFNPKPAIGKGWNFVNRGIFPKKFIARTWNYLQRDIQREYPTWYPQYLNYITSKCGNVNLSNASQIQMYFS